MYKDKSNNTKIRAYLFSIEIVKFVNSLPNKRAFWSVGDQLLRAACSIGANLIEAKSSSSKRDFLKFYQIALKSANETEYWLCLIRDTYPDIAPKCNELLREVKEISNMLGKSVLTLKGKTKI